MKKWIKSVVMVAVVIFIVAGLLPDNTIASDKYEHLPRGRRAN